MSSSQASGPDKPGGNPIYGGQPEHTPPPPTDGNSTNRKLAITTLVVNTVRLAIEAPEKIEKIMKWFF